jgi:DNA-binding transcriptional ArsR family regulator
MSKSSAAPLFAALGDETRLALVSRLASDGPLNLVRLGEGMAISRQAVSKHLALLAGAGLVLDERRGRERYFRLEPRGIDAAQRALERISSQWDVALDRLRKFVEET